MLSTVRDMFQLAITVLYERKHKSVAAASVSVFIRHMFMSEASANAKEYSKIYKFQKVELMKLLEDLLAFFKTNSMVVGKDFRDKV